MPRKGERTGLYVECENCGKLVYKTLSQFQKRKHHYCSNKCQSEKKHKETFEDRPCEICGKPMHVSKKSNQRFCSDKCQNIWQSQQTGLLNSKCTSQYTTCTYCGKSFLIQQYRLKEKDSHFCSTECRQEWYANVWSQLDEWKEESRKRAANLLKNMESTTMTKPQLLVNNILDKNGINYINEQPYIYYSVDNYLKDYNLIIEVMGDYWHGNPLKYKELNDMQRKNVGRDKAKHTFIKKYYNIEVLYLWEMDILHNHDVCEALIKKYIANNGILNNYNSFNYILKDDNLILKSDGNIIDPYSLQDCQKEIDKIAI